MSISIGTVGIIVAITIIICTGGGYWLRAIGSREQTLIDRARERGWRDCLRKRDSQLLDDAWRDGYRRGAYPDEDYLPRGVPAARARHAVTAGETRPMRALPPGASHADPDPEPFDDDEISDDPDFYARAGFGRHGGIIDERAQSPDPWSRPDVITSYGQHRAAYPDARHLHPSAVPFALPPQGMVQDPDTGRNVYPALAELAAGMDRPDLTPQPRESQRWPLPRPAGHLDPEPAITVVDLIPVRSVQPAAPEPEQRTEHASAPEPAPVQDPERDTVRLLADDWLAQQLEAGTRRTERVAAEHGLDLTAAPPAKPRRPRAKATAGKS